MYYQPYHPPVQTRGIVAREPDKSDARLAPNWITKRIDYVKKHYFHEDDNHYNTRLLKFYRKQHAVQELLEAGLTNFDTHKRECRHLVRYLHPYEHIKGAVCGRLPRGGSGLLAATNLRIIFLHQVPLFSNLDELSYDLVSGVTHNQVGNIYDSVTLHTRSGDYELNFVRPEAAAKFADFIEKMSIDRAAMKEQVARQFDSFRLTRT